MSTALPNALHVTIPAGKTGAVGFANTGFFGKHHHFSFGPVIESI